MHNRSYESRIADLFIRRSRAHDVPVIQFTPHQVAWKWSYFIGAALISLSLYFAIVWLSYEVARTPAVFCIAILVFSGLIIALFAPVLIGISMLFDRKKQTRQLELFK